MANNLIHTQLPATDASGATISDARERAAELRSQQLAQRDSAISELTSSALTAQERIRLWEKLHGANLPRKPDHPVLAVIAESTGLTLEQVGAEQRRRSGVVA